MTKSPSFADIPCRYFPRPGRSNTGAVLEAVARRAEELSIERILVATCSGRTAFETRKRLSPSLKIIAVTHVTGFSEPNVQELSMENRRALQAQGVEDEIMAYTLRIFGQGTKVAVEIAMMASDAGLVRAGEDVISIGGTAEGADTALLLKPATSAHCLDLRVREVICKPGNP